MRFFIDNRQARKVLRNSHLNAGEVAKSNICDQRTVGQTENHMFPQKGYIIRLNLVVYLNCQQQLSTDILHLVVYHTRTNVPRGDLFSPDKCTRNHTASIIMNV